MAEFAPAFEKIRQHEGGWCNVAGDAGGETYAGISRVFFPGWAGWPRIDAARASAAFSEGARAFSALLALDAALQDKVAAFYRDEWWDRLRLATFPQKVAEEFFEQAVNLGQGRAALLLQRLLNACNLGRVRGAWQPLFADLACDGAIGPKTLAALAAVLAHFGEKFLLAAMNAMQASFYIELAAAKPEQRKFLRGWLARAGLEDV